MPLKFTWPKDVFLSHVHMVCALIEYSLLVSPEPLLKVIVGVSQLSEIAAKANVCVGVEE